MDIKKLLLAINNQDKKEIHAQLDMVTMESDRFQLAICLLTNIQSIFNDHDLSTTHTNSKSSINKTAATSTPPLTRKYETLLPLLSKISPDFFNTTATKRMAKLVSISIKARALELAKSIPLITPQLLELFSSIFNEPSHQAKEIHNYFLREFNTVIGHCSTPAPIHLPSIESLPPSEPKNTQPYVNTSDTPHLNAAVDVTVSPLNTITSLSNAPADLAASSLNSVNIPSSELQPFQLFTNVSDTGETYWVDLCRKNDTMTKQFLLRALETIKATIDFPGKTILPFIAEMGLIEIFDSVLKFHTTKNTAQNDLLATLTFSLNNQFYDIATILLENQMCFAYFKTTYHQDYFINYFKIELNRVTTKSALVAFYQRLASLYFPLVASPEIAPFSLQTLLQTIEDNDHHAALKFLDSFTSHEEKQLLAKFIDKFIEMKYSPVILLQQKIKAGATQWEKVLVQLVRLGINEHLGCLEKDKSSTTIIPKSVSSETAKKISRYRQIRAMTVSFSHKEVTLYLASELIAETDKAIERFNAVEDGKNNKQPLHMTRFQVAMLEEKSSLKAAAYPNKNKAKTNWKWRHCYTTSFASDTTSEDHNYRERFSSAYRLAYLLPSEINKCEKNNNADKLATELSPTEIDVLNGLENNLPHLVAIALAAKHSNSSLWTHTIKKAFYTAFQQQHYQFIQIFLENVTFTDSTFFYVGYNEFLSPLYYIEHSNNHLIQYLVLNIILQIENRDAVTKMSIYYLAAKYRLVNCLANLLTHHNQHVESHEHNDFAALDLALNKNYSECIFCFLMHNSAFLKHALVKQPKMIFQLFENLISHIDTEAPLEVAYLYMQRLLNFIEENIFDKQFAHKRDWQYLLIQLKIKALILIASDLLKESTTPSKTRTYVETGLFHHVLNQMCESKTQIEYYLFDQWRFLLAQYTATAKQQSTLTKDNISIILMKLNRLRSYVQSLRFYNQQTPIDIHMSNAIADLQNIRQVLEQVNIGILPLAADLGLIEIIRYMLCRYTIPTTRRITMRLPDKEKNSAQQTTVKPINSSHSGMTNSNPINGASEHISTADIDKAFEYIVTHQFVDIIELLCSNDSIFIYLNDTHQIISIAILIDSLALMTKMIGFNRPTADEVEILLEHVIENKNHKLLQPLFENKESVSIFSKQNPQRIIEFISSEINCANDIFILYKIHIKLQSTYQKLLLTIDKKTLVRSSTHQSLDKLLQLKALQFIDSLATEIPTQVTFLFKILTDTGDNFCNCYPYLLRMIQNASKTDTVLKCYEIIRELQRLIIFPHQGRLQNQAICKMLIIALKEKALDVMRCALQPNDSIDESFFRIFALNSGISNNWDIKMHGRAVAIKKRASMTSANSTFTPLSLAIKALQKLQLSLSSKTITGALQAHTEKMAKAEQILQLLKQPHSDTQYNSVDLNDILPILHEYRTTHLAEIIDNLRIAYKTSRSSVTTIPATTDALVTAPPTAGAIVMSKLDYAIDQFYAASARLSENERARRYNKIIIFLEMGETANKSSTKKLESLFLLFCDHINKPLSEFLLYLKQLYEYEMDEFSFDSSPDDTWFNLYQSSLGIPPTKNGPLDEDPHFYQKRYKQIHHDYLLIRTTPQRLNFCIDYQLIHLLKNLLMNCISELSLKNLQTAFHKALKMQATATIEILLTFIPPFIVFMSADKFSNSLWYYLQNLPENDKKGFSILLLKRLQDCLEQNDSDECQVDLEFLSNKERQNELEDQRHANNNEHYLLSFLVHMKAIDLTQELLKSSTILICKEDLHEAFALAVDQREYELVYLILNDNCRSLSIAQKLNRDQLNHYLLDEITQLKNSQDIENLRKKFPVYKNLMENGITHITLFKSAWDAYLMKFQERVKELQPGESIRNVARTNQTNTRASRQP